MASTIDQALAPDCARSTTRPGVSLTDARPLLVAWIALSEVPTLWQGIGAGTIIAGVILTRM